MISYTTLNYSDIYDGIKPDIKELLKGINSKIVVILMAVINSELEDEKDVNEVQQRLTSFVMRSFDPKEFTHIFDRLKKFSNRIEGPIALWGKRYTLELMKNEFLNYRQYDNELNTTPEQETRIFKAYLLTAEELNEQDRVALKTIREETAKGDPFFFEKLVWPFVLKQFDTNNRVDPIVQLFKLLAFIKHSITQDELLNSWKEFIAQNQFETLRQYLGYVHSIIQVYQRRFPEQKWLTVFSWINATEMPAHLKHLSFDINEFRNNPKKQVDYLGLREKPLFESKENEFVVLDLDFLNNKIYNGPLFDMYSQTDMATKTKFKSFPDFKTYIGSSVSENIIFKGILNRLFNKKQIKIYFDDKGNDSYPDCYIRYGSNICLIEFKDYLFPGKLVEQYSFNEIKKHIDAKFIRNEKGKNKGISQIIEQLKILETQQFEYDHFDQKNIKVYPIIVHTNFTYQMPGVNHYLNEEFKSLIIDKLPNTSLLIEPLVLIDLDTLFDLLQVKDLTIMQMLEFLIRYSHILENRKRQFFSIPTQDNFIRARACFDEIFRTIIGQEQKFHAVSKQVEIFMDSINITEEMFDSF